MKIVGIKKVNFTDSGGKTVSGQSFFLSQPIEVGKGDGDEVKKVFLSTDKLSLMAYKPKLYDEVTVFYNEYGKAQSMERAK